MFIVDLLWTLVRVALCVCLVLGLLRVTKTRLRHVPTRRTRISRHHGETTLWLERLVNAVIDMTHWQARMQAEAAAAAKRQHPSPGDAVASPQQGPASGESLSSLTGTNGEFKDFIHQELPTSTSSASHFSPNSEDRAAAEPSKKTTSAHQSNEIDNEDDFFNDAEKPDDPDRPVFLALMEERVNAALEDSGIAAWSDFRIRSVGDQPPRVKAIHILHAGLTQAPPPTNAVVKPPNVSSAGGGAGVTAGVSAAGGGGVGGGSFAHGSASLSSQSHAQAASALSGGPSRGIDGGGHLPSHGSSSGAFHEEGDGVGRGGGSRRSPKPGVAQPPSFLSVSPQTSQNSSNHADPQPGAQLDGSGAPTGSANSGGHLGQQHQQQQQGSDEIESAAPPSRTHARVANAGVPLSSAAANSPQSGGSGGAVGTHNSTATTIEFEAEVEYSGGLDISLRCDLSVLRGRQLPLQVRFHKVKYMRAHIHVVAALAYDAATIDAPAKPHLQVTLWLESDPAFDLTMRTAVTRLNIRNFFLLPILVKFFVLRLVRAKCKRSNGGPGLTVRVPLPEDIVDGGELWGGGGGGMSRGEGGAASAMDGAADDGRSSRAGAPRSMGAFHERP